MKRFTITYMAMGGIQHVEEVTARSNAQAMAYAKTTAKAQGWRILRIYDHQLAARMKGDDHVQAQ